MFCKYLRSLVCIAVWSPFIHTGCKSAPDRPHLSEPIVNSEELAALDQELAALEAERADLVAAQQRLDRNYSSGKAGLEESGGMKSDFDLRSYLSSVKGDSVDSETSQISEELEKSAKKGDHESCKAWLKKLIEHTQSKKDKIKKRIEDVDGKIKECKKKKKECCKKPDRHDNPSQGGSKPPKGETPPKGENPPQDNPSQNGPKK